ncbi:MAG: hypothetical protein BWY08_01722 [Bacteroidetes bacterium ADurb.Bin174]|jgi:hypothetical protein|nr:MAG: hypothetical protein BWY08_01722 [Bacteroidetes bacterium ADurb.Bin174]
MPHKTPKDMKASNHFKNTIKTYLDQRAETDVLFSFQYSKPEKNIDDCVTYILNEVKKSGCNGFADDEIYSMAVHYYDEDNIEVGKPMNAHVVVNHVVELTEEEKEQARKDAIQKVQDEAYRKMIQPVKKAKKAVLNPQPSLFDF